MNAIPMIRNLRNGTRQAMAPFASLPWELDQVLDRFFDGFSGDVAGPVGDLRLEVSENDERVRVRVELPGVAPADVDVSLHDGVLTISGEKRESPREEGERQHYSEHRYGQFRRSLKLAIPVDADRVQATHAQGVLTIDLPKAETAKPRRIQIKES